MQQYLHLQHTSPYARTHARAHAYTHTHAHGKHETSYPHLASTKELILSDGAVAIEVEQIQHAVLLQLTVPQIVQNPAAQNALSLTIQD